MISTCLSRMMNQNDSLSMLSHQIKKWCISTLNFSIIVLALNSKEVSRCIKNDDVSLMLLQDSVNLLVRERKSEADFQSCPGGRWNIVFLHPMLPDDIR